MFGQIAGRYDLMNHLMTAGLDVRWRRLAARQTCAGRGDRVLDACCGTGDLSFALASHCGCEVVGLDLTEGMLARARHKAPRHRAAPVTFLRGDLLALPFADDSFAAATVGWGVRNVPDVGRAFAEMVRVTRPGGRVVCLEATQAPPGLGRRFHDIWLARVVPWLGQVVARDRAAYSYLPASVRAFPDADGLAAVMHAAGLRRVRYRRLGFGAMALHVGDVPA